MQMREDYENNLSPPSFWQTPVVMSEQMENDEMGDEQDTFIILCYTPSVSLCVVVIPAGAV